MKKTLLVSLLALLPMICFGQEGTHLKFKGIPLDGEYKAFAEKLVQKGFREIESSDDGVVLVGNFMATPEVKVLVYPDPKSRAVSMVSAMIEAGDNWPTIANKYRDVVSTYKEKYGEPKEHVEEFTADMSGGDSWRMMGLHNGQCNYKTVWETAGGQIVISLAYVQRKNYVICAYADEQNVKALKQSIIDDI